MAGVGELGGGVEVRAAAERGAALSPFVVEQAQQPVAGGQVRTGQDLLTGQETLVGEAAQVGGDPRVLALEVLVARALGDMGDLGQLADAGGADALAVEEPGRRPQDPLPGAAASAVRRCAHPFMVPIVLLRREQRLPSW